MSSTYSSSTAGLIGGTRLHATRFHATQSSDRGSSWPLCEHWVCHSLCSSKQPLQNAYRSAVCPDFVSIITWQDRGDDSVGLPGRIVCVAMSDRSCPPRSSTCEPGLLYRTASSGHQMRADIFAHSQGGWTAYRSSLAVNNRIDSQELIGRNRILHQQF